VALKKVIGVEVKVSKDGEGRLLTQIVAGRPAGAGVVGEVQHGEDRTEPFGQFSLGRHPVWDVCRLDLVFGPDDALGHRGLGDEECAGHLIGGEAAK
jgi:hypothetical protein